MTFLIDDLLLRRLAEIDSCPTADSEMTFFRA